MDSSDPHDGRPGLVDPTAVARLGEDFPALAHALESRRFGRLAAEALERADDDGRPVGAHVERVVMDHMLRLRSRRIGAASSRLAADLAAVEWALLSVAAAPPTERLPLTRAALPADDELRRAVLSPVETLRLVPVAFALQAYIRRAREGRRPPPPRRADHTLAVARPRFEPLIETLTRGEGRLLGQLGLGVPVGEAVDAAAAQGWVEDATASLASLRHWAGWGLFADLRLPAPSDDDAGG